MMNKSAIKKFSVWAREKLLSDMLYKANLLGISETEIKDPMPQSDEKTEYYDIGLTAPVMVKGNAIRQRKYFAEAVKKKNLPLKEALYAVLEEAAYTWFNRLIAVRFMEVNGYLPGGVRILSSEIPSKSEPDIVTDPFSSDMEFDVEEKNEILRFKNENKNDELFRFMLIKQCRQLSGILPGLFEKTGDFTEVLLPLTISDREDGIVYHLVNDIQEQDWKEQVQIIGWLYQYYNSVPKNRIFEGLKKNIKISRESIPAATQLFTPDWIVRYMVENSLGRLVMSEKWLVGSDSGKWLVDSEKKRIEAQKAFAEKMGWDYFLPDAEQSPDVRKLITDHYPLSTTKSPEEILFLDPCMGSGHILVYAFDVLMDIYRSQGYSDREAAQSIVKYNLYGLEIDDRAAQLAYFSMMMKARSYDRCFFSRGISPAIYSIRESSIKNKSFFERFGELSRCAEMLCEDFADAKEYGSIIRPRVTHEEIIMLCERFESLKDINAFAGHPQWITTFEALLKQAEIMSQKYHCVVTNPPYMASSGMNRKLSEFIRINYSDYKSDLFSVFMIRCSEMTAKDGYLGLLTPLVWMFIKSYQKLREYIYRHQTIGTLIQFEYSAFEEAVVPICSFVLKNSLTGEKGGYIRLTDFRGGMDQQRQKVLEAVRNQRCGYFYQSDSSAFSQIPGSPAAYWLSCEMLSTFEKGIPLKDIAEPKQGLATGCNDIFIRRWFEVSTHKISFRSGSRKDAAESCKKWFPYNKGGDFRKWYGNNDYIVNWENDGEQIRNFRNESGRLRSRPQNVQYYFRRCFSWSLVSSGAAAFRLIEEGSIFDIAGMSCFAHDEGDLYYLLSLCNSKIAQEVLKVIAPTINYQCGDIADIPVIKSHAYAESIVRIAKENIALCKEDWDSFETSCSFQKHRLI